MKVKMCQKRAEFLTEKENHPELKKFKVITYFPNTICIKSYYTSVFYA